MAVGRFDRPACGVWLVRKRGAAILVPLKFYSGPLSSAPLLQSTFDIAPAVQDAVNHHGFGLDVKRNSNSALEARSAQAGRRVSRLVPRSGKN
jgi:hypothetical protein